MSRPIRNEERCAPARELEGLTDDSKTGEVKIAAHHRIEQERDRDEILRDFHAIRDRFVENLKPGPSVDEIIEGMYGEFGEPI